MTSKRKSPSRSDEPPMLPSRRLFTRLFAATAAGAFAWRGSAGPARADDPAIPRVAYHLSDIDKVTFVLGNIENHIEGMGGPEKVHIVLVVHGPALTLLEAKKATPDVTRRL